MFVVTIARDADEAAVHSALATVGRPWRPPYNIPRLLFVDGGTAQAIEQIEGVLSCQVVDRSPPTESLDLYRAEGCRGVGSVEGSPQRASREGQICTSAQECGSLSHLSEHTRLQSGGASGGLGVAATSSLWISPSPTPPDIARSRWLAVQEASLQRCL